MEEVAKFTAAFRLDDLIILRADQSSQLGYMVSRGILYAASDWFRKMLSQGHGNSSAASDPFASLFASDTASKPSTAAATGSANGKSLDDFLERYLEKKTNPFSQFGRKEAPNGASTKLPPNPFGGVGPSSSPDAACNKTTPNPFSQFGRKEPPNAASTKPPPSLFNFTDPTNPLPKTLSGHWIQPPPGLFTSTDATNLLPKTSSAASTKAPANTFKFTGSTTPAPTASSAATGNPPPNLFGSLGSSNLFSTTTDNGFKFGSFTALTSITLPNCDHETLQLLVSYLLNGHKVPRFRTEYTRVASECDAYKIRTSLHASSVRSQILLAKLWCLGDTVQMPRLQNITMLSLQDLLQVSGVTVETVEATFEMTGEESKLREMLVRELVWNWKAQAYGQGEMDRLGKISGFMVLFAKMLAECPTRECAHKPHCAPSVGGVVPFFVAAAGEKRSREQMEAGRL